MCVCFIFAENPNAGIALNNPTTNQTKIKGKVN